MWRSCHPEGPDDAPPAPRAVPRRPVRVAPPEPPPLDPEKVLAESDMEFVRASGPGGQHRNKRETGVRLVHRPTGVVALATERRSQAQNRALAIERLVEKLEKKRKKPKPRKATKKPRGVRKGEVEVKRKESVRKRNRQRVARDDD
jgi:ribosome-associated protein